MASEFTQAVAAGTFVQAAFVDPNDPSTVYVTQVRDACVAVRAVCARCCNASILNSQCALQPVESADVPVAYPQNNLVATAVPVDPAAGGAAPAVATVVATQGGAASSQASATPPVAVASVVPSTGFQ